MSSRGCLSRHTGQRKKGVDGVRGALLGELTEVHLHVTFTCDPWTIADLCADHRMLFDLSFLAQADAVLMLQAANVHLALFSSMASGAFCVKLMHT